MKHDVEAGTEESIGAQKSRDGLAEDSSGLIAGWMLACLVLSAALLAAASATAYSVLFGFLNPNLTAGLIGWIAILLVTWLGLTKIHAHSSRVLRSSLTSLLQVVLLTLGFAGTLYVLLPGIPRVNLALDSLSGSVVANRAMFFGLAGFLLAVLVWLVQLVLTRASLSRGKNKARGLLIGFALVAVYFLVLSQWVPSGVTAAFTQRAWLPLLLVAVALYFAVGLLYGQEGQEGGVFAWRTSGIRFGWSDAAFVIVPMTPIASYMVVNREYLTPITALLLLVSLSAALFILIIVLPKMVAGSSDPRVVMAIAAGGAFTLTVMAALSRSQAWFGVGSWTLQALVLVAAISVLVAFTMPPPRVLLVAALVFAMFQISLAGLDSQSDDSSLDEIRTAEALTIDSGDWDEPLDIIVLTYESYANEETMNAYGIDNSAQMEFLTREGFTIYDGTYSNGSHSTESMSRFLNASSALGSSDERRYTAGYAQVPQLLGDKGYSTAGIFPSDYYFGIHKPQWDYSLPEMTQGPLGTWIPLASGIFRGEFRADLSFNATNYGTYLVTKRTLMMETGDAPLFHYTHNSWPGHSQNSGQCLPDETEKYVAGLQIANEEMRIDVDTTISSRPNAVVVIAGDHGPYLTKNCSDLANYDSAEIDRLDIQDRYGTFLAIRWPTGIAPGYDIEVLQEVMPAVLAYVSKEDSYWNDRAVERATLGFAAGSVRVEQGIIKGGIHGGEPLFLERGKR